MLLFLVFFPYFSFATTVQPVGNLSCGDIKYGMFTSWYFNLNTAMFWGGQLIINGTNQPEDYFYMFDNESNMQLVAWTGAQNTQFNIAGYPFQWGTWEVATPALTSPTGNYTLIFTNNMDQTITISNASGYSYIFQKRYPVTIIYAFSFGNKWQTTSIEYYEMSFRSPKYREIVRKEIKKSGKVEVNVFETGYIYIYMTRQFGNLHEQVLKWTFKSGRVLNTLDKSKVINREIGGLSIDFDESSPRMIVCYTDHPHLVSVALISHLNKEFNCMIGRLNVELGEVEDLSLYFKEPVFKTCETLEIHKGSLSADEMIRFLEGFPDVKRKRFSCNPGSDFVFDKSLSGTTLEIEHAYWVTCDNLISADCRDITLSDSKLTSEDLNRFVKTRLESGRVRKENLTINNQNGFDMSVITSGLSVKPHNSYRSSPNWLRNLDSSSDCVDVIRESDGMVITIGTDSCAFYLRISKLN